MSILPKKNDIFTCKIDIFWVIPLFRKMLKLRVHSGWNKNLDKKSKRPWKVNIFDFLRSPKPVLSNPQTTILAIIGTQLMHNFDKNSPLGGGGGGQHLELQWQGEDLIKGQIALAVPEVLACNHCSKVSIEFRTELTWNLLVCKNLQLMHGRPLLCLQVFQSLI